MKNVLIVTRKSEKSFGDHIPHTPFRTKGNVFSAGFRNFIKYSERTQSDERQISAYRKRKLLLLQKFLCGKVIGISEDIAPFAF